MYFVIILTETDGDPQAIRCETPDEVRNVCKIYGRDSIIIEGGRILGSINNLPNNKRKKNG